MSNMFESIKNALNTKGSNSSFKDFLKTEVGKSYVVRFIANENVTPIQTFYQYYHHGWTSKSTGQFVHTLCPSTNGERCPICEQRFKLAKSAATQDLAKDANRKQNWLASVYVISDPTNPDNNGTVKLLRFGKQIKDIITNAVEGDDKAEVGSDRIFDLTENGCSFRIKVEKNEGGFPTFVYSKFLSKGAIEGLTPDKIKEIKKSAFNLLEINKPKTTAELTEMINTHLLCVLPESPASKAEPVASKVEEKPVVKVTGSTNDKIRQLIDGI